MAEEEQKISTPAYDNLPEQQRKIISGHVVERTNRLMAEGKLPNDEEKVVQHMHKEIERLAKDPVALKLEIREEELLHKLSKIPPEQLKELAEPNKKHGVTGGENSKDPHHPCVNTPSLVCDDNGHRYTRG
jgi:hypothetical protein